MRRRLNLDIAEWLGLSRPRDIRGVITDEANFAELERHGKVRSETALKEPGQRGFAATEYWLNLEQARSRSACRVGGDARFVLDACCT